VAVTGGSSGFGGSGFIAADSGFNSGYGGSNGGSSGTSLAGSFLLAEGAVTPGPITKF